jgi:hypothetical protein
MSRKRPTPRLTHKRNKKAQRAARTRHTAQIQKMERYLDVMKDSCAGMAASIRKAGDALRQNLVPRKLVPENHVFKMKQPVCPICGGTLYVHVEGWTQETTDPTSDWLADTLVVECEHAPDLDSDEFDAWMNEHYRMPYVDWLPLEQSILAWMKKKYRFQMEVPVAAQSIAR